MLIINLFQKLNILILPNLKPMIPILILKQFSRCLRG
jgi:hypothetical protein